MTTIRPFLIDVEDAVLADLKRRLEHTCFPDEYDNDDWKQGTSGAFLRSLCEYWRNEYDWRKHEAALNAFDHFETEIDGQHLHFIHQRSKHDDALPLLIQHGWPGSVFEFHKIIGPLTDPEAHGGDVADAFHVVCPSMPGYGWSRAPSAPGTDIRRVAELDIALMNALGYDRWVMQGGDWGAVATSWAAKIAPKGLMAAHFNMLVVGRPREGDPMEGVTEAETAELMRFASSRDEVTSYQNMQRTKPQSLGVGLGDSPAALAAWITEKFHGWSDCDGDILKSFTMDELLTNIMIYWTTGSITASLRLYRETHLSPHGHRGVNNEYVDLPCGFAVFPKGIVNPPRAWVEKMYNVQWWRELSQGGHFAALEEPELLVDEIREFFRAYR